MCGLLCGWERQGRGRSCRQFFFFWFFWRLQEKAASLEWALSLWSRVSDATTGGGARPFFSVEMMAEDVRVGQPPPDRGDAGLALRVTNGGLRYCRNSDRSKKARVFPALVRRLEEWSRLCGCEPIQNEDRGLCVKICVPVSVFEDAFKSRGEV